LSAACEFLLVAAVARFSSAWRAEAIDATSSKFYLGFRDDRSGHVLRLLMQTPHAETRGIDPHNPPLVWEAITGENGVTRGWVACTTEFDSTLGFTAASGELVVRVPADAQMIEHSIEGKSAYWLRCRLTEGQSGPKRYTSSPRLERLEIEVIGGTTFAPRPSVRQATIAENELLGYSDGTPGQTFNLQHAPVLPQSAGHILLVQPPGHQSDEDEVWQEVPDFSRSDSTSFHFTLDQVDGTVNLGPALLQPNDSLHHFGHVPRRGARLTFRSYSWGGGRHGNVGSGRIGLKDRIPGIRNATNHQAATGGIDAQSVEDAKLHLPAWLKTPRRAVTADDIAYVAATIPGVARAHCVPVGSQENPLANPAPNVLPGTIHVVVLPQLGDPRGLQHLKAADLRVSDELQAQVTEGLRSASPLGIRIEARAARCTWVWVRATLHVRTDARAAAVRSEATAALEAYLNPFVGGPDRTGWPFGRVLRRADVYNLLQHLPGVEFAEALELHVIGDAEDAEVVSSAVESDVGAANYDALFKVDGQPRETIITGPIGSYTDRAETFLTTIDLNAGDHTLQVLVDPNHNVTRIEDPLDVASVSVNCTQGAAPTPAPKPASLQVALVDVQDPDGHSRCVAGNANNVHLVLKNTGDSDVSDVIPVQLSIDGKPGRSTTIGGVAANNQKDSFFTGVTLSSGTHTLKVTVDPDHKVGVAVALTGSATAHVTCTKS
jgi:Baseplate J-like protein/CARDB